MKHFDKWSILVIVITFVLFVFAIFAKGMTHDLLLEAGIFLVSVKIIQLTYSNSVHTIEIKKELNEIKALLRDDKDK